MVQFKTIPTSNFTWHFLQICNNLIKIVVSSIPHHVLNNILDVRVLCCYGDHVKHPLISFHEIEESGDQTHQLDNLYKDKYLLGGVSGQGFQGMGYYLLGRVPGLIWVYLLFLALWHISRVYVMFIKCIHHKASNGLEVKDHGEVIMVEGARIYLIIWTRECISA